MTFRNEREFSLEATEHLEAQAAERAAWEEMLWKQERARNTEWRVTVLILWVAALAVYLILKYPNPI